MKLSHSLTSKYTQIESKMNKAVKKTKKQSKQIQSVGTFALNLSA